MTEPRTGALHLLSVWNPAYVESGMDVMDAHIEVLVERTRAHRQGTISEEDVHVWWGRIRSERRQTELPHLPDVLELDRQIEAEVPTYLYLTDYSSLYVADLGRITVDNIQGQGERAIPAYYGKKECDLWFQIWDIRRLVAQDTRAVVQELRHLKNTRYFDQPVSLFGGVVDLPLLVWRDTEVDWFGDREALTDNKLWAERDAEFRSDAGRISADLRDNLLGARIWNRMEPSTRTFLASAEAEVRARREDPAFDFSSAAVGYAKALETEVNAVLFAYLRKALQDRPQRERLVVVNSEELDLGRSVRHQGLGALHRLLLDEPVVKQALQRVAAPWVNYFTNEYKLPSQLKRAKDKRNPAAHSAAMGRESLLEFRDELLGIGGMGVLVELVKKKDPESL